MELEPPSKKRGNIVIIVVVVIVIVAGVSTYMVYLDHNHSSQSDVLSGKMTNALYPIVNPPTLEVTLNNPSKLTNPYNVTITLDLPNGQSVALGFVGLDLWEYHDFGAIVNMQSNLTTDFVISTGTEIGLTNTANTNYNFSGTKFILTYTGFSGAITYNIG